MRRLFYEVIMIFIYKGNLVKCVNRKHLHNYLSNGWSTNKSEVIGQEVEVEASELDRIKKIADENGVKYRSNSTIKNIKGKLSELGIDL